MPRFRIEFSDGRQPEVLEVESGIDVMQALCEIHQIKAPLTPSRMKGICEVWLLGGNDKPKWRFWP
jgi:hypothetical protein